MNKAENPDTEKRLTLSQAARILNMSTPTLKKLALTERKVTCTVFGRRIRFRMADLETYIAENTFHAQPEA